MKETEKYATPVWASDITLEEVMEAYCDCRKNKRGTANALAFEVDWEKNCVELWREITERRYEIGKSIVFVVTRPKLREVFAADFRDRVVHHVLMNRIGPLMEAAFIDDNYNCRKGKGTLYGVERLLEKTKSCGEDCYIRKNDIQGFFMAIHKPTLWKMVSEFLYREYKGEGLDTVLYLSEKIIMHCPNKNCRRKGDTALWEKLPANKSLFTVGDDYGLPIGNLTSQIFANFYMHGFDMEMSREFGGMYGRYVDDYYVLSEDKEKLMSHVDWERRYLADNLKLTLHPDKMYVQHCSKGVKFVGSVVKNGRVYAGNKTAGNWIDSIRELNAHADNVEEYAEEFAQRMNSYMGFLRHGKCYALRRRIVGEVDDRWWRVCYISGHFEKVVVKKKYKQSSKLLAEAGERTLFNRL